MRLCMSTSRSIVIVTWVPAAILWLFFLTAQQFLPTWTWLLDWHVYAAGAEDFLQRTLYSVPLDSPYRLPIDAFNHPPLAALVALPLLILPDGVAGTLFVGLNVLAMAATSVLVAGLLGARHPWAWGGAGFLVYTVHPWVRLAFLGNNTPLVLLLVVLFAHLHFEGRDRAAGWSLGLAIALKLWPIALIPFVLRERRWPALTHAALVVVVSGLVSFAWLGLDAVGPALEAMQERAVIEADNPVFLLSWVRETQPWWPWWGGMAVAAVLALIPAGGRVGIGLGILAGLALVPNLWRTYLATFVVGLLLVTKGLRSRFAKAAPQHNQAQTQPRPVVER